MIRNYCGSMKCLFFSVRSPEYDLTLIIVLKELYKNRTNFLQNKVCVCVGVNTESRSRAELIKKTNKQQLENSAVKLVFPVFL